VLTTCKLLEELVGASGFDHRPPGPEPDSPRYLLDNRTNIFAINFILGTKSTFMGGQLGGYFSCVRTSWLSHRRTLVALNADGSLRVNTAGAATCPPPPKQQL